MYSFKYKKTLKILTCLTMLFSFNTKVFAAKDYTKEEWAVDLYKSCNEKNNCIPICIYSCSGKSEGCYDEENNKYEYSYYGHYYGEKNENDNDGLNINWSFGVLNKKIAKPTLFTWTNDKAPSKDGEFYFLEKASFDEQERTYKKFRNTNEFKELSNSFICPKSMKFDEYTNKIEVKFTNTNDGKKYKNVSYSFVDELEKVITTATPQSIKTQDYNSFVGPINLKEIYDFMEKAAGYNEYNSSLSEEQNSQKMCNFLNNKNSKIEDFVKDFSSNNDNIKQIINEKLSNSTNNVRFKQVYTYDNLNGILEGNKIVDKNNVSYMKRVNNIYTALETNTIAYFNNKCELGLSDENIEEIGEQTSEKVMENLVSETHKLNPIDYDEQFDCDTLFGGEIAKIISGAYFIIEMAGLGILIIFTVIDYAKVILNGESDEIKKQNAKLLKRLIIVAVLFILPALVNTTLRLFHIEGFDSENPLCVRISNK